MCSCKSKYYVHITNGKYKCNKCGHTYAHLAIKKEGKVVSTKFKDVQYEMAHKAQEAITNAVPC